MTDVVNFTLDILHNGQWLSPLAILISGLTGAFIAYKSLKTHREVARKRATLDVILKSESDEYFERIYSVFATEKNKESGLEYLLKAQTEAEKQAKTEVDNFLNHYELIAISIEQNILDETFYKNWMRSTYINHFNAAKKYIAGTRIKNPKAYITFENLAHKWERESKQ